MQVNRYIFQSPYSSQVQFGTPDPSVKKETETQTQSQNTQQQTTTQAQVIPNESVQNAQSFASTIIKEVTPTVSNNILDTYA
ncbi:hypothetical protein N9A28_03065 [Sulfurimonas sp.]|nr:hypothetical protein [Sulfurimonas sp.]